MARLFEEVAYVAYHFHWSREEIMALPHKERHRWIEEISRINRRINETASKGVSGPIRTGGPQGLNIDFKEQFMRRLREQET